MAEPKLKVTSLVLNAPDARELAGFYARLLGWQIRTDEPSGSRWPIPTVVSASHSSLKTPTSARRGRQTPNTSR